MLLKRRPAQIPPAVGLSRPKSAKPPRWYELGAVLLVGWLVLLALTPHVTEWLNPPTGDEPFYLVTAISLIKDHDLDEYNNYYFRDYQDFAPTCADMAKPRWGDVGPDAIDSVPGVY